MATLDTAPPAPPLPGADGAGPVQRRRVAGHPARPAPPRNAGRSPPIDLDGSVRTLSYGDLEQEIVRFAAALIASGRPPGGAADPVHGRHPRAAHGVPGRPADRRGPGAGQHDAQAQGHRRAGARQPRAAGRAQLGVRRAGARRRRPAATSPTSSSSRRGPARPCPRWPGRGCATGTPSWPPAPTSSEQAADARTRPCADSPAFWLYTSGTTGTPKGAMHRHGSLRDTAETYARDVLAIGPDDVTFSVAKFFFAYGLGNTLTFPFSVGASTVLDRSRPSPAGTLRVLRDLRPTLFFGGPTYFAALLRRRAARRTRSPACGPASRPARRSRRPCSSASRARSASRCSTASARPRCCTSSSAAGPAGPAPATTGEIVAGYEAKIVDDDGNPVARRDAREPVRPRQLRGHRLLVPDGDHPTGLPGALGAHRRHLRAQRATATTARSAVPTTSSRPAASGSPPPRWRSGCAQHPDVTQVVVVVGARRRRAGQAGGLHRPAAGLGGDRRGPGRRSAGRGWPPSSAPATCSSSTSCRPPRPASCSVSASANSPSSASAARRPPT